MLSWQVGQTCFNSLSVHALLLGSTTGVGRNRAVNTPHSVVSTQAVHEVQPATDFEALPLVPNLEV